MYKLFSGNASIDLARNVSKLLGIPLEVPHISKFNDGEIDIELNSNVRGDIAFIIQSTCSPTNDNLMELVLLVDALKRSSIYKIIVFIPYFGYARQDRRMGYNRTPISAKVVADILLNVGINHIVTVDLHSIQVSGFFNIPVDILTTTKLISEDIDLNYPNLKPVIVSPDVGGIVRARSVAKRLDYDLCIVDKRRSSAGHSEVMNVIGSVEDRHCILVDDIGDSCGTICNAANVLIDNGALSVLAYITHPVFSKGAIENINNSKLTTMIITDTIPTNIINEKIRVLSIASLISDTIKQLMDNASVSEILK